MNIGTDNKILISFFLKVRESHYILDSNHYRDETGEKMYLTFQWLPTGQHKKFQLNLNGTSSVLATFLLLRI